MDWRPDWTHAVAVALGLGIAVAAYLSMGAYYVGRKYPNE